MLSQHVWEQLAAARYGLLRLEEFEQWIYDATDLETVLRGDDYLALLSFSFRQPHVQYELSRLVDALYKRNRPALQSRDLGACAADGRIAGQMLPWRRGVRGPLNASRQFT